MIRRRPPSSAHLRREGVAAPGHTRPHRRRARWQRSRRCPRGQRLSSTGPRHPDIPANRTFLPPATPASRVCRPATVVRSSERCLKGSGRGSTSRRYAHGPPATRSRRPRCRSQRGHAAPWS